MSLLDRIKDNMYGWERGISEVLPGYKGYKQKELRREADKLLRDTIASRMATVMGSLNNLQQELISSGEYELLDEMGSATTQLQTFIDRVRHATYGYSGLFDAVRVKEEDLERVYEFDATLLDYADRVESAVTEAQSLVECEPGQEPEKDLRSKILAIRNLAREANATFDRRQEVLSGSYEAGSQPGV
jgi:DNA repair ATPase RecN